MNKCKVLGISLFLSGVIGFGGYYEFVHEGRSISGITFAKEASDGEIYVDSVGSISGMGNANGMIQRYAGVVEVQEEWKAKKAEDKKIAKTYVKEDDLVKAGDPLFAYDVSEDREKIEKDEIALQKLANDNDTLTKKIAKLEKELAGEKNEDERLSTQMEILGEENQIKQNEYEAKTTQAEIDALKENIDHAVVKSEISGIVKSVNDAGDGSSFMSNSEDNAYITIMTIGDLRIKGYANEQNIRLIREGMPVIAYSRVEPDKKWFGTISQIKSEGEKENSEDYGSSVDNSVSSTKYPFYVEMEDTQGFMLGQHVYLEEDKGQETQPDGIWLDSYYLEDGGFVWAEDERGRMEKRQVRTGEMNDERDKIQILEGLSEEDHIALPGQDMIEEGMKAVGMEFSDQNVVWEDCTE